MNVIGLIQGGERQVTLSEEAFNDLCVEIEKEFDIAYKFRTPAKAYFKLKQGTNGMKWVTAGNIELLKVEQEVIVKYSIDAITPVVMALIISSGFFLYKTLEDHQPLFGIVPFVIFMPAALGFTLIAVQLFKLRVNNLINRITSLNFALTKQQQAWINDPTKCPACGYSLTGKEQNCPDCELRLK